MFTRQKIAAGAAAVTLLGGVPAVPGLVADRAEAADGSTGSGAAAARLADTDRPHPLTTSLRTLVAKGTLTQAQADAVVAQADADRPRGGPGHGRHEGRHGGRGRGGDLLATAALTLSLSEDALRTKLRTQTLGQVADTQKVSRQTLIEALLAAHQAEATTRITQMLDAAPGQRPGAIRSDRASGSSSPTAVPRAGTATPSAT